VWFKVLGMLVQNWAVCEPATEGCQVRFFDDGREVFDQLGFLNKAAAGRALDYNGFTRIRDEHSGLHLAGLPGFSLSDSDKHTRDFGLAVSASALGAHTF
jgi:hypothetical protein